MTFDGPCSFLTCGAVKYGNASCATCVRTWTHISDDTRTALLAAIGETMTDNDTLAGILAATEEDLMPRVVAEFEYNGQTVSIIEPVHVTGGKLKRGYLWHAIIGDFVLAPTRPGDADPERWTPGRAEFLPGGRLVAMSSKSAKAAATNARRKLAKQSRQT